MKPYKDVIQNISFSSCVEENILRAAEQLFLMYGIRSVSLDDICRILGISKKTFYKYFQCKEVLVKTVCDRKVVDLLTKLENLKESKSALEQAWEVFDVLLVFGAGFSSHFFKDIELKFPAQYEDFLLLKNNIVEKVLSGNIKRGIQTGEYRSNIDPETISRIWFELIILCYKEQYHTDEVKQHFIRGLLKHDF